MAAVFAQQRHVSGLRVISRTRNAKRSRNEHHHCTIDCHLGLAAVIAEGDRDQVAVAVAQADDAFLGRRCWRGVSSIVHYYRQSCHCYRCCCSCTVVLLLVVVAVELSHCHIEFARLVSR